jgi:succinate dehydrogenase/fumarate reductase flavoprotein subunit
MRPDQGSFEVNSDGTGRRPQSRISRRAFLVSAGIGSGAAALGQVLPLATSEAATGAERETDVAVVGTGAAAWPAALIAQAAGARVEIFEKGTFVGGTTRKSGGVYWVPNNPVMQQAGLADPRAEALRYMARLSYPELYSPDQPFLGLSPDAHALLETFYRRGSEILGRLQTAGILESTFWPALDGPFPDYHAELPENAAPRGRSIVPKLADGSAGSGADLIAAFERAARSRGIPIHLRHAARRLIRNDADEVVGIELATPSGPLRVRARRGVIFCTGGFAHNPRLVRGFLRGITYGACEVPTNEGDFISLAQSVGARLGNMKNAAWKQVVLEQALEFGSIPNGVAVIPGDSSLMVNRYGMRVVNEKLNYNQRGQVHFDWDAREYQYRNQLLFMIYDSRCADAFAGVEPIPMKAARHPEVLSAPSLEDLAAAIDARLRELDDRVLRFRLDPRFTANLAETIQRFNGFARTGVDRDFYRGETLHELAFHGPRRAGNDAPSPLMYPLSESGPYHAMILAAGTYGTRGGPVINAHAQVLHAHGEPVPGLYGAGNCVASPAAGGYWGGGAQLGPGIVFGGIAGEHAAAQAERKWT